MRIALTRIVLLAAFLTVLATFSLPAQTQAAVTVAASTTNVCPFCNFNSFSHTVPAGDNRLLLVTITAANNNATPYTITDLTYGGVALTLASSVTTASAWAEQAVYYMIDPPVGTANVGVAISGVPGSVLNSVVSLTGVNVNSPFRTVTATNNGDTGVVSSSLSVSSAPGDLVFNLACNGTGVSSHGVSQTRLFLINNSASTACDNFAGTTIPGAGNVTTSWTFSGSDLSLETALSIRPASGGLNKPANKLGLVGYWSFNEGTGKIATDFSGNGNAGTITDATWASGKLGKALMFSSFLQAVSVGSSLDSSVPFSISVWINPDASGSGSFQTIFSKRDTFVAGDMRYSLMLENTASKIFLQSPSSGVTFDYSPPTGTWTHVTVVATSTGTALYVNGRFQEQQGGFTTGTDAAAAAFIGVSDVGGDDQFIGLIDEPRIYSRALSTSEAAGLYRSGTAKVGASSADLSNGTRLSNGLVGHWTFDGVDFTNTGIVDRSGNGNTGYLVALGTSSAKAAGKLGQAFNPASVGRINVGSQASLNNLGPMTVCTWERVPDSIAADYQQLFDTSNDGGATNGQGLYIIGSGNVGGAGFGFTNLDGDSAEYHNAVVNNGWHHLCAMWDGTDTSANIKLFLDGELVTVTAFYNDGFPNADDSTHDKYIGALSTGSFQSRILIDDMRIYNRMLSNSEVRQLYNLGTVKIIP